jgi:hypothetical protein
VFSDARRGYGLMYQLRSLTRLQRRSRTGGKHRHTSASCRQQSMSGCSKTRSTSTTPSHRRSRARSFANGSTAPRRASSHPYEGGHVRATGLMCPSPVGGASGLYWSLPTLHSAFFIALHPDTDARLTSSSTVARSSSSESRRGKSMALHPIGQASVCSSRARPGACASDVVRRRNTIAISREPRWCIQREPANDFRPPPRNAAAPRIFANEQPLGRTG